ncbi:hypothetical protein D3C87_1747390 [compost metagenome]
MDHAARRGRLDETRIVFWPQFALGFFLGIEVIEVAEEFIKAVVGGQIFILVAQVVLTKLSGGIALGFQHLGDRNVPCLQTDWHARHTDFREPGTQW